MSLNVRRAVDPEEVADALVRSCATISAIISKYGGTFRRSESDRHLACWGWPTANDDDSRLAVAAALEIVGSLGGVAKCGVEAGIAVARQPGDSETVIAIVGEVVAQAMELQRLAPPGAVLVSSTVRRLISGAYDITQFTALSTGSGQNHRCWLVLGGSRLARRHRLTVPAPFVGRDAEVAALAESWERVKEGEFRAVHLQGPAGVGKSGLVTEIRRLVARQGGTFLETQCLPELQGASLAPVHDLIGAMRHFDRQSRPEFETAGGAVVPPSCAELTISELRQHTARIARGGPLAVVFEDTQWADRATLRVLSEIAAEASEHTPFLLLATSRASPQSTLYEPGHWQLVELDVLSATSLDDMLQRSPIGKRLSPDKRRLIAEHADGIPLYAWELAHLCADTPEREAHHRLLAQPNRLNPALASRLDALETLKPLAQAGAVLGREFDCRLLAVVLSISVRALTERLHMLVDVGILSRSSARSEHRFRFVHAMIWSAANGSVTKSRRRELHARAAAELIVSLPQIASAEPERVAHHYDKAANYENAFKWWHQAALRASPGGLPATVIFRVNRALAARSLAPESCTPFQEAELLGLLGAQISTLRGSASAETVAVYVRALQLIAKLPSGPADLGFEIGWGLTAIHLVAGNTSEALASSIRLVEMARELGREEALLVALRMNGTALVLAGHLTDGIRCLQDVVALYDRHRHRLLCHRYVSDPGAAALAHISRAQALAGKFDDSLSAQNNALDLAAWLGHDHTSANVLGVLATAALHRNELGLASALAHACHAVSIEHGYAYWRSRAMLVLAWLTANDAPSAGLPLIEEASRSYRKTGSGRATMLVGCLVGEIAIRAGQPARALEAVTRWSSTGGQRGDCLYTPEIMRLEALAQAAIDPSATPVSLLQLQAAEALAREHGTLTFAHRVAASRARLTGSKRFEQDQL